MRNVSGREGGGGGCEGAPEVEEGLFKELIIGFWFMCAASFVVVCPGTDGRVYGRDETVDEQEITIDE